MSERIALVTGVSSGIGHALATRLLESGWDVFGVSRRVPHDLIESGLRFCSIDLTDFAAAAVSLGNFLSDVSRIDLAILNAGVLGPIADLADQSIDEMKRVMDANLWASKAVMDGLLPKGSARSLGQVVMISSGASVNGNRGWGGYSLSKAALNMMARLYAAELPGTHVSALAPGLVDTAMQEYLCTQPEDSRFPSLQVLKSKRNTSDMPRPQDWAGRLIEVMATLPQRVDSGSFVDVRSL
ncbi:MAG: SDR family NAD(P)-dependent oxidoreductase [Pirellulaceae bacterium]